MPISRRLGIRGRLILNVVLLVALSLWLLGLMLLRQNAAFIAGEQRARGRSVAAAVEKALGPLLGDAGAIAAGPRRTAVEELLATFAEDPGVAAVTLRDVAGRTVAAAGRGPGGQDPGLTQTYPVSLRGESFGSLSVTFSPREAGRRAAYTHLQVLVQLGLTALVLVVFLNLLISLTIIGPIRRLAAATERIAGGDLDHPVEQGRPDEIGDLAASLDAMRLRLREGRALDRARLAELARAHADREAAQAELVRSERLAAVGGVAASVAHEVGNPLAAVTGYLAMLRGGGLSPQESREYLERIERDVARINRIMLDLLDYARPPRIDLTAVDVNALLRDLARHLATERDFRGVALDLRLAERLPPVRADYHRTRQLLLNLSLNAAQALAGRGTVTLESLVEPGAGKGVALRVRDDGPGITPEILARLFEPFATAGKGARGTGLGLAICRRSAEAMGASLDVETTPGAGTAFTLRFPVE
jgi:signal transduction histidine kinase